MKTALALTAAGFGIILITLLCLICKHFLSFLSAHWTILCSRKLTGKLNQCTDHLNRGEMPPHALMEQVAQRIKQEKTLKRAACILVPFGRKAPDHALYRRFLRQLYPHETIRPLMYTDGKTPEELADILTLLGELGAADESARSLYLNALSSPSKLVRSTAFQAACQTGDTDLLKQALHKATDESSLYLPDKELLRWINAFDGYRTRLEPELCSLLNQTQNPRLQSLLLMHFVDVQYTKAAPDICLAIQNSQQAVLWTSAMKYFALTPCPQAEKLIVKGLQHPDWEVQTLSALAAVNQRDQDVFLPYIEANTRSENDYTKTISKQCLMNQYS